MKKTSRVLHTVLIVPSILLLLSGCNTGTKEDLLKEGVRRLNAGDAPGAIVFLKKSLEKDRNYFDARRQLAKAYLADGKYKKSAKELRKILLVNPSWSDAHLDLSRAYLLGNKPDDAMIEAKKYLHVQHDSPAALDLIGRSYLMKNDLIRAEAFFLQAIKAGPRDLSPKLGLAWVYLKKNDIEHARDLADEVVGRDKRDVRAYYLLARIEEVSGDTKKALAAYQRIVDITPGDEKAIFRSGLLCVCQAEWKKADEAADRLLKRFPQSSDGYTLRGLIHYSKRDFVDAIIAFQNSVNLQPTATALYFLGLSQYYSGYLEQALSQFNRILDNNPSLVEARLMRSAVFLKQKRFDDAIAELANILQTNANNAVAYNMIGSAYIAKGMYDKALKALDSAIRLDPALVNAQIKKGALDIAVGNEMDAEADLKTTLKISPDLLKTRLVLATYYWKRGDFAKSIATLKEGMRGKKTDAVLYSYIASALFSERRTKEALSLLVKAKEIDPYYFVSYFKLAGYYAARGDYERALGEYNEVLKKDPENISALVDTAMSLESWGKNAEARAYYEKARETKDPRGFLALAGYFARKQEPKKAIGVLGEAIRSGIGEGAALAFKGKLYLSLKMYPEATAAFERLEAVSPGEGFPSILKTCMLSHNYEGALERIKTRLDGNPGDAVMRAQLVKVYVAMKDWRNALNNANAIIAEKPDSAFGYGVLSMVYQSQDNVDGAFDALKKGRRIDGRDVQTLMMLGELYSKKKEYGSALDCYDEAARINPFYFQAVFAEGVVYEIMGKKGKAVQKYREVCQREDRYVPALNNLAYLLLEGHGSEEEALELAMKADRIEPMNGDILDTMGYALLKNGRRSEALRTLKKAVALRPENSSVCYHIALAYEENGDKPMAIQNLRKSLRLGDFPESHKAVRLLAELTAEDGRGEERERSYGSQSAGIESSRRFRATAR